MKKFLAFIMALVVMSTSLTGCGKQETVTETFDWGGITIDIPTDYKLNYDHAYDNTFGRGNQSVMFMAENYTGIMIVCMQGAYMPDDKAALGNDTIVETLEEDKYTMDGYEVRYGNYKTNSTDNIKLFTHVFSLYLSDRWIVVQAYTGNKKINKEQKSIIDSITISDNQYEFPCFNTSYTGTSIAEEPKQTEIIDLNDLRPSPTPELIEEPYKYEYYGFYDISIPVPDGFIYDPDLGSSEKFVFNNINYETGEVATITVYETQEIIDPYSASASDYKSTIDLYYGESTYPSAQDYFVKNGNVIKSHITTWVEDAVYEDFDITVCLADRTIEINMFGMDHFHDVFQYSFDYIGGAQ